MTAGRDGLILLWEARDRGGIGDRGDRGNKGDRRSSNSAIRVSDKGKEKARESNKGVGNGKTTVIGQTTGKTDDPSRRRVIVRTDSSWRTPPSDALSPSPNTSLYSKTRALPPSPNALPDAHYHSPPNPSTSLYSI